MAPTLKRRRRSQRAKLHASPSWRAWIAQLLPDLEPLTWTEQSAFAALKRSVDGLLHLLPEATCAVLFHLPCQLLEQSQSKEQRSPPQGMCDSHISAKAALSKPWSSLSTSWIARIMTLNPSHESSLEFDCIMLLVACQFRFGNVGNVTVVQSTPRSTPCILEYDTQLAICGSIGQGRSASSSQGPPQQFDSEWTLCYHTLPRRTHVLPRGDPPVMSAQSGRTASAGNGLQPQQNCGQMGIPEQSS